MRILLSCEEEFSLWDLELAMETDEAIKEEMLPEAKIRQSVEEAFERYIAEGFRRHKGEACCVYYDEYGKCTEARFYSESDIIKPAYTYVKHYIDCTPLIAGYMDSQTEEEFDAMVTKITKAIIRRHTHWVVVYNYGKENVEIEGAYPDFRTAYDAAYRIWKNCIIKDNSTIPYDNVSISYPDGDDLAFTFKQNPTGEELGAIIRMYSSIYNNQESDHDTTGKACTVYPAQETDILLDSINQLTDIIIRHMESRNDRDAISYAKCIKNRIEVIRSENQEPAPIKCLTKRRG